MVNENLDETLPTEESIEESTEVKPEIILPEIEEAPKRVNPFCVISKGTFGANAVHDVQTNTSWSINPYGETYLEVPDELVPEILVTRGYCDIELNEDGTELVSFTAREIPEPTEPEREPTTEDDLLSMAVDHEYRLTLLELGVV